MKKKNEIFFNNMNLKSNIYNKKIQIDNKINEKKNLNKMISFDEKKKNYVNKKYNVNKFNSKENKINENYNINNRFNLNYNYRLSEEKIRLKKLKLLEKFNLLNMNIIKERKKNEFFSLFSSFINKLLIFSLKKYKKNINQKDLRKKEIKNYLLKVQKLNFDGKIEMITKLKNQIRTYRKKIHKLKKKKNFNELLKKKNFFFIKKKLNFKIFNKIYKNKIYNLFFFYLLKKFKLYGKKNDFFYFNKKNHFLLNKQENYLLKKIINELNYFFFKKNKKNNNLKKFRRFYYKYVLLKHRSLNFLNYLRLKKLFFFFIKKKYIKKRKKNLCYNRFLIKSFEDSNKFVLFPSFIERYYYFGFQKKIIRIYKLTKNFFYYFNDIKKIRSFFFFNTNISVFFNIGYDIFPTFWTKRKELSFFWRFFFYLITKWLIFYSYTSMSNCNFMYFKNRNYLKLIYINSSFFFELHNIMYDRFSFNFISFIKNHFNFFKLRERKRHLFYSSMYTNISYFLFENLLLRKKDGFLFLLFNKNVLGPQINYSFMSFFNDYFLFSIPKKISVFNLFKTTLQNIDNQDNIFNLNNENEIFNFNHENNISKKRISSLKKKNKFVSLKKKENETSGDENNNINCFALDKTKLFIYDKTNLLNNKKKNFFSSNIYNQTTFISGIPKKKIDDNENNFLYLKKILLEIGVHLGTEVNGRGRFTKGYNDIMNYYLLGFFKIKNMELMDYKLNLKKISYIPSILKKGFLFHQTIKYPVINISSTIFILKQAMIFILSLGKKGGRMLFSHSEITKNPGFVLFLSGISNIFGHSFNYMPWIFGAGSNYSHMIRYFFDNFFYHGTIIRQKIKGTSFISFFFRILFLNCFLVPKDLLFSIHEKKTFFFWKTIIFFRYFSHYFWAPDVVIGLNPNGGFNAVTEYGSHRMANISAVDTDGDFKGIAYAIPSNDDSLSIAAFYFNLFINAYEKGRLNRFHSNFSDILF